MAARCPRPALEKQADCGRPDGLDLHQLYWLGEMTEAAGVAEVAGVVAAAAAAAEVVG
jgi:hypothetical protein